MKRSFSVVTFTLRAVYFSCQERAAFLLIFIDGWRSSRNPNMYKLIAGDAMTDAPLITRPCKLTRLLCSLQLRERRLRMALRDPTTTMDSLDSQPRSISPMRQKPKRRSSFTGAESSQFYSPRRASSSQLSLSRRSSFNSSSQLSPPRRSSLFELRGASRDQSLSPPRGTVFPCGFWKRPPSPYK